MGAEGQEPFHVLAHFRLKIPAQLSDHLPSDQVREVQTSSLWTQYRRTKLLGIGLHSKPEIAAEFIDQLDASRDNVCTRCGHHLMLLSHTFGYEIVIVVEEAYPFATRMLEAGVACCVGISFPNRYHSDRMISVKKSKRLLPGLIASIRHYNHLHLSLSCAGKGALDCPTKELRAIGGWDDDGDERAHSHKEVGRGARFSGGETRANPGDPTMRMIRGPMRSAS